MKTATKATRTTRTLKACLSMRPVLLYGSCTSVRIYDPIKDADSPLSSEVLSDLLPWLLINFRELRVAAFDIASRSNTKDDIEAVVARALERLAFQDIHFSMTLVSVQDSLGHVVQYGSSSPRNALGIKD